MSRVIKRAVLHGEPKIVENSNFLFNDQSESVDDIIVSENRLAIAATCSVMLEENKKKAAEIISVAEKHRNEMIEEAKLEAEKIIEEAKLEAEKFKASVYETSKQEGYTEGEKSGRLAAESEMCEVINSVNEKAEKIIKLAENESKNSVLAAEAKIVAIAMAVADKVIPQHFIDAPQVILPLVKAALEKVKDQNSIVIKVSPENYEFVLMAKNELQMMTDGEEVINIVADQLLGNDGCIIESANGNVDARLETQMEIIRKAVQEVMK